MNDQLKSILCHDAPPVLAILFLLAVTSFFVLTSDSISAEPVTPVQSSSTTSISSKGGDLTMEGNSSLIAVQLSAGQAQPAAVQPPPLATGTPLTAEEIEQILSDLPPLETPPAAQTEFQMAGELLPPPRPGETIQEPFPPKDTAFQPTPVPVGPLEVLRYAPQGEIPLAPFISVTFNQPMTALATLEELAAQDVPVQIEPALPGRWRWQGARTLTFEYESALIDRLPKATEFRVTIPAGTRSATGGALPEAVSWSFRTPPPAVVESYPGDIPQPQDPLFFIAFDQRIDPQVVLGTIRVSAQNKEIPLELASEEAIQADERVSRLATGIPEGRWLAFRSTQLLPTDTTVNVIIGPGTPSAEGPLTTVQAQSYSFRTYAPLRVVDQSCPSVFDRCQPLQSFYIRFNNPLDEILLDEQALEELVQIEPELPGMQVNLSFDSLIVQGMSKGRTTYAVRLSSSLRDVFGQALGKDVKLSFHVGPAEPALFSSNQELVTLDPVAEKAAFPVYVVNYSRLAVKIYAVQPGDWQAYQTYRREASRTDRVVQPPGRLVFDDEIRVDLEPDQLGEVQIDLSQVMEGPYGHYVVMVSPPGEKDPWRTVQAWVQATQIGLDAFADHSTLIAWASSLKDGAPLSGVTIQANPGGAQAVTGADGLARLPIPSGAATLVASLGADQALLPRSTYFWSEETWSQQPLVDSLRWYVFDDRQMYRPGEEVHLKGWLRRIGAGQTGDVGLVGSSFGLRYRIIEAQGNDIGSGQAQVNALGGFDLAFRLPEKVNLGQAYIILTAEGAFRNLAGLGTTHSFQIQEFRRPEFEVTSRNETEGPYFAGGEAVVSVEAKYYAGGALPNAEVTWQVASSPGSYAPPNWPDFVFGVWRPWWMSRSVRFEDAFYRPGVDSETTYETFSGVTDAEGKHYLKLAFGVSDDAQPVSISAESTVMDVNRQAWTSRTNLLVHPAELYVGLRSERYFVARGDPLEIDLIVTDLDGNPIPGRKIEVTAGRLKWVIRDGEWQEQETDLQQCNPESTLEPVRCTFETSLGGSYQITAVVIDDLGRKNRSQLTRWVSGGELPPARKVEQEDVTLIPDQESYQPGDTARILVQSPFSPAEGLLTVSRSGILYTERFSLVDGSATLAIPIESVHIPNLMIQVDLVGSAPRSDDRGQPLPGAPARPAFASGTLTLSIPPLARKLSVAAVPEQGELEPGGETTIRVQVKDARGQPVSGAELAVVVVDEAILALSNYQLQDPLSLFYAERPSGVESQYGRSSLVLSDPQSLAVANQVVEEKTMLPASADIALMAAPEAPAAEAGMSREATTAAPVIRVRSDFNPLAAFAPAEITNEQGEVQVAVKLPDNLTRYRIMVVAVAGGSQFGTGEANLTARLPLMVRPSAPRFLNFGDQVELPVVLQNQTDQALEVEVVAQASNLELLGSAGLRVTVPARDRVEVRFPAQTVMAGTATLRLAAVSGSFSDAATISLPVYTPATSEAFATYGVIDEGMLVQPVQSPQGVFAQYGGLEINTSSTALQALTDAVLYLVQYPYDCSEQIASRLLAIAALRDVLSAFQAEELPDPVELEAVVEQDIRQLQGLQNYDGGFPYWRRGAESIPFHTIHVAHALERARQKGFSTPAEMQSATLEYLRNIERYYPSWYGQQTRWTLSAYALYVRNLMGDRDLSKALNLYREAGLENLSLDALGWLYVVLQGSQGAPTGQVQLEEVEAIRRQIMNRAVETAGAANFTTRFDDQNYLLLGSNRRTDAILLDAMITNQPDNDLIPKLVNGLLAQRTKGRWLNTQENVFVLLALDHYFNVFEAQQPDFVARIWLGETYAGEQAFRGRTTERYETDIPMSYLVQEDSGQVQNLILTKEGPGRLYYRLGLRYAPTNFQLDPLDMGFVVQRRYEAVDNPEDVTQDENGVWQIKAGSRVRVRLTMVADNRRYHVALADPLPAGLEIINPSLAVSSEPPPDPTTAEARYGWWWWGPWYEHQNLRDERAEAFTSLLWDGVYEYSYIARATTPGTFIVPPAKAEEMYSPEVFGRSGSDVVVIK